MNLSQRTTIELHVRRTACRFMHVDREELWRDYRASLHTSAVAVQRIADYLPRAYATYYT